MKPLRLLAPLFLLLHSALLTAAEATHNFDKWEKDIARFEQMDRTNPPPKHALLFIGSSTIARWKTLADDFPDHRVINRGFGGSEIVDSTHFAARIIFPYEPSMIFLRAGGNDLFAGKSPEQVFADFREFVARTHSRLPETEIVFISWTPTIARWAQASKEKALNDMVEAYAHEVPRLKFIDAYDLSLGSDGKPRAELFVADKLHFNEKGYKLLVERVRPFLPKP